MPLVITLNGERREVPTALTLDDLLDFFALPKQRVAVEHNGGVVRRVEWAKTAVSEDDRLEIVHFVGGG